MSDDLGFTGPEGVGLPLKDFDFKKMDKCGFVWEIRIPGVDCEASWDDDSCANSLTEAVNDVLPNYREFGLTVETAARLLLEVGIIAGTGMEIEE
jgi:hypothetical protein